MTNRQFLKSKAYRMVKEFFKNDNEKVYLWFHSANPLLGGLVPMCMIVLGRYKRLLKFIETQLEENKK